jgi:hypothetical protein
MSSSEIKEVPIQEESGKKVKRQYEMTPARKEAFERCVAARREIVEFRKNMKASPEFKEAKKNVRAKAKKLVVKEESESEVESVEEIVEVKKKGLKSKSSAPTKAKTEKKKVVVEEDVDDEEEEEDVGDDDSMDSHQMHQMKTQMTTQKRMKLSHEKLYGPEAAQGGSTKYTKEAFVFL